MHGRLVSLHRSALHSSNDDFHRIDKASEESDGRLANRIALLHSDSSLRVPYGGNPVRVPDLLLHNHQESPILHAACQPRRGQHPKRLMGKLRADCYLLHRQLPVPGCRTRIQHQQTLPRTNVQELSIVHHHYHCVHFGDRVPLAAGCEPFHVFCFQRRPLLYMDLHYRLNNWCDVLRPARADPALLPVLWLPHPHRRCDRHDYHVHRGGHLYPQVHRQVR